jgi:tetratricopeptide (TPR) repeat protein
MATTHPSQPAAGSSSISSGNAGGSVSQRAGGNIVRGDNVGRDKIGGDNVAGDKVAGPKITNIYGPTLTRFSSARRTQQEELIQRHDVFGGRDAELAKLDALVSNSPRRLHFIHAASGFGKTALLANWVLKLRHGKRRVCWQFINRFEGMADEEFALRNLCEQLAVLHEIVDELPASIAELRSSYLKLLQIPFPEGGLIVVLDGLDEAKGWSPGPYLLPKVLPQDVQIVFSARAESDYEASQWLSTLGLDRSRVDVLRLSALSEAAVAKLLEAAGGHATSLSKNSKFVHDLTEVSKGDPFYLHFLVKDVIQAVITPKTISQQPSGLHSYLDLWKTQLFEDVVIDRDEVYALLGLLSAALGPLKPVELSAASPALQKGLLMERELAGPLRRYLSGSRESGYALGHPRFRDYLAHHVFGEEELPKYRQLLLDCCRRWRENKSEYALNYYASHLADLDLHEELFGLVSKEWKDARTQQFRSPQGLVSDLETAMEVALSSSTADIVPLVRCGLAYATVASIIEQLPLDLLAALTRLDGHKAARDYASLLRSPERRVEAYGAIATALEQLGQREEAVEALALSLASAERIWDAATRAPAVLAAATALNRLGQTQLVAHAAEVLETASGDLTDPAVLEKIADFFHTIGQPEIAAELRERSKTAKDVTGSPWNIDLNWPLEIPGFNVGQAAKAAKAAESAQALFVENLIAESLSVLTEEKKRLESESELYLDHYSGDDWLTLANGFARAGDNQLALESGNRAYEAALASPETYLASRTSRLIGVAQALATIGSFDAARRSAKAALETIETSSARQFEDRSVAALAAAASLDGRLDEARRALAVIPEDDNWSMSPTSWWSQFLVARLMTGGAAEVARLRKHFDSQSDTQRAIGRAHFGRALAIAGKKRIALKITEQAIANSEPNIINADVLLEAARTLVACGSRKRAIELLAQLMPSTEGSGSRDSQAALLSELTVILAEVGAENALKQCKQVFDNSVTYNLLDDNLRRFCELLVELNERTRALALIDACASALQTMADDDWKFGKAFANVVAAAGSIDDDRALERLSSEVSRVTEKTTQLTCWAALALGWGRGKSKAEAKKLLARALDVVLASEQGSRDVRESLGAIATGFGQLNDHVSLATLCEWALGGSKYEQPKLLRAILPAIAASGDRATIDLALGRFSWDRWAERSLMLAVGSSALLKLGDLQAAKTKACEALEAFLQEGDGSATPNVLPYLIPALVAVGDGNGLVQLSKMPASKWPYAREWGPGVRLLLPALARLGLDDVRPRPYQPFLSEKSYFDKSQVDLAAIYAERGLYDRAVAAADEPRSPKARAEAHVRIAEVMADSGDSERAKERLMAALSRFPAIRSDALLIAEMASLAAKIGVSPRACWILKQTFLSVTEADVVIVDVAQYRNASRAAARIGDSSILKRMMAVISASRIPNTKAATGAALALALAESNRHEDLDTLKSIVHREVQDIGDVAQRVGPLLDLAQAVALHGRPEDAKACVVQALDCARHSGRSSFLDVLAKAAPILLRDASAADIATAIVDVGALWA